MEIKKDKRYLGIYLTCVILATTLTILVIIFMIYMAKQDNIMWLVYVVPFFALVGDLFAFNSLIGYIKTPELILKIDDDSVSFTPDKTKELVTIKISDIKGVQLVRPLICRSGKTIIINTDTNKYKLEDIEDVNKAYEMLVEKIKG